MSGRDTEDCLEYVGINGLLLTLSPTAATQKYKMKATFSPSSVKVAAMVAEDITLSVTECGSTSDLTKP